jgi:hypothetical protein
MAIGKLIWSCSNCETVLRLSQIKCTNCHRLALSWLHVVVGVTISLSVLFVVFKLIK